MGSGRDDEILDLAERELWRAFLSWSQSVIAQVGRELDEHAGLSIPDMEVLSRLWDNGGSIDQQELLSALRWSPSRLSHHLARMDGRGLVHRETAGSGRRMTVSITEEGERQTEAAFGRLASSIRRHFLDPMTLPEREALGSIAERR